MARSSHKMTSERVFVVVVGLLVVASFMPAGWLGWARGLGQTADTLLTPVQDPVRRLVMGLVGGEGPTSTKEREELLNELSDLRREAVYWKMVARELEQRVGMLQSGIGAGLEPAPGGVVAARVAGTTGDLSSGLLKVVLPSGSGVVEGSVVVVNGAYLVGRVVEMGPRIAYALPITVAEYQGRAVQPVRGMVVLEDGSMGPVCDLVPDGNGALSGDVAVEDDEVVWGDVLRVGMTVVLADERWLARSRGCIVGVIERVGRQENLRPEIVVRPVYRPDRVTRVLIRIPGEEERIGEMLGGDGGVR